MGAISPVNQSLRNNDTRKRPFQRKAMNAAYKKNTDFMEMSKIALQLVEDLLMEEDLAKIGESIENKKKSIKKTPLNRQVDVEKRFLQNRRNIHNVFTFSSKQMIDNKSNHFIDTPNKVNAEMKSSEKTLRNYQTAVSKYTFQMEVANNNFQMKKSIVIQNA